MNYKGYLKIVFVLVITATVLTACAPTVRISKLKPARVSTAAHLNKITVLTFDGKEGRKVSLKLKEMLEDIYVDGEPYFSVVSEGTFYDRASGYKCIACKDDKHILSLAKATGADAVLAGSVTENSCTAELFEEKETRCIEETIFKKGAAPECTRWREFYTPCVKNTASYEFSVRLVEIQTGHYLYTDSFRSKWQSTTCRDNLEQRSYYGRSSSRSYRSALRELTGTRSGQLRCRAEWEEELLDKAFQSAYSKAAQEIPRNIAPHYESVRIPLMTSTEGIKDIKIQALLADGVKLARNRNLTKACTLWKEAIESNPAAPSLTYNLGVCAEFKNKLELAEELYEKAATQHGTPSDTISQALDRITKNIKEMGLVKGQLFEQEKSRQRKEVTQ